MRNSTATDLFGEVATRLGIPKARVEVALAAAEQLDEEAFAVVEKLLEMDPELASEKRHALCRGWARAAEWCSKDYEDILSDFDEPMEVREAASSMVWADVEARTSRAAVLRESIGVAEAARRTGRSRQAIEKQRAVGHLLALRVGRQWRYPSWQFDPDGKGSVLPGLPEVIEALQMSPAAAAVWLASPQQGLKGEIPTRLLLSGKREAVLRLAQQHGHLP